MESTEESARLLRRRLLWSALALLGGFALLCAAWAADSVIQANTVARNVHVQGANLAGMTPAEVREYSSERTESLRDQPVTISIGDTAVDTDLVRLGVRVDQDRLVSSAFAARTGGSLLTGPFRWLAAFNRPVNLDLPYVIDGPTIEAAVDGLIAPQLDGPQQPLVALGTDQFIAQPGTPGIVVDAAELLRRVEGLTGSEGPFAFSLTPFPQSPELSVDEIGRVALELNDVTATPLEVRVLDQTTRLEPDDLRSLIDIENSEEGSFWQVNQTRAVSLLRDRFERLGDASQQARFIIVQDKPEIVPANQTLVCCDDKTAPLLRAALLSEPSSIFDEDGNTTDGEPIRTVELLPIVTDGTQGVAELEALGINELVGTFTTNYQCCQNRVVNIQLFADTVRGTVIEPGEVLSLNELVGERTPEKGYKEAGAINLGSLEPQYGGGISQAITTIFNAAFFAGLDFDEYQSHSLYFSRYPEGREATISWRRPDLKLRNATDHGVLIWTEHTATSVTVSMYSTKHIEVEALPVVRRSQGQCRRVTTPRRRTYPDGRELLDEVFAVYRPAEGLDCNGNPSDPDAVPPTTTPPVTIPPTTTPPTTTPITPPPTQPPVTDPPATDPPVTDPPASDPPPSEAPAVAPLPTDPPVTEPPVTEPPTSTP